MSYKWIIRKINLLSPVSKTIILSVVAFTKLRWQEIGGRKIIFTLPLVGLNQITHL